MLQSQKRIRIFFKNLEFHTFCDSSWRLVRGWKVQSRGSLRDFRGSARDSLAGRPSSREKHLEKFSELCSWVLWRLELATVWRLNPVAKFACLAEIGAVLKLVSVFPRIFVSVHLLPPKHSVLPFPISIVEHLLLKIFKSQVWVFSSALFSTWFCAFPLDFSHICVN